MLAVCNLWVRSLPETMVTRVATVAFEGIEARAVDVQVQIAPGAVAFTLVGLPDKAVAESRERVRSALIASGLALPAKRITCNLAPADLPKEGSHYDLPIALAVMGAIGALPADALGARDAAPRRLELRPRSARDHRPRADSRGADAAGHTALRAVPRALAVSLGVALCLALAVLSAWIAAAALWRLRTPLERLHAVGELTIRRRVRSVISDSVSSAEKAKPLASRMGTGTGVAPVNSIIER